jgi:DNA-binding NarL/FixJ family response regulator
MSAREFDASSEPTSRVRILVVADHPLIREGLTAVLQREPDLCVCGEAEGRQDALEEVLVTMPHLVILDLGLKNSEGLDLIKDLHLRFHKPLVLVVSAWDELLFPERALRAGASGYITKEESSTHVVEAVRRVLRGDVYVSQRIAGQLAFRIAGRPRTGPLAPLDGLSDRELQILQLFGEGFSRKQVAERLHLDVNTIETYRARIKQKIHLKDAHELLQYAIRFDRQHLRG